jgi:hypothetical protein
MDATALGTAAAIAMILVPVVSLIKRPTWSPQAKYLLGMAAAFVAAVAGAFVDGNFSNVQDFAAYFGTALASSQTLYTLHFENSKLEAEVRDL